MIKFLHPYEARNLISFVISGLYSPPDVLVRSHKYTSYLASVVGLSCFATEYFQNAKYSILGRLHLYSCICIVALQIILSQRHHFILSEFASSSAVVSIFLISAVTKDIYGILYALGMIFFGIVVGTEGQWIGFPAVDVFHYGLVLTNYCLVRSFLEMA